MKEVDKEFVLGVTHVISNPCKIKDLLIDLIRSSSYEIFLILPTANAFLRKDRIGIMQILKKMAEDNPDLFIRILTPTNNGVDKIIRTVLENNENANNLNIDIKSIEETSEITINTVTILVIDRKVSLVIEKADDSKENFIDAIGSATYSSSRPTVLSYISIFQSLWKESILYEKLKVHDKMQKEFINIASHEMKTPVQAILGYVELFNAYPEAKDDMINAIFRNALRLQKLTQDILDVTKIESNSLKLNKESFNLSDKIRSVIYDFNIGIHANLYNKNNRLINIEFKSKLIEKDIIICADKIRVYQVISNLLNNAFKFTNKANGSNITIDVIESKEDNKVTVGVKDEGTGIDSEIIPNLFNKFVTKSENGMGLGLFISKSIVEAHGGNIWAENNHYNNEKGSTFYFSLPLL
jgi:signal transduction histidine kinase